MDVVLALHDRDVCEDERCVDFLMKDCEVFFIIKLGHLNVCYNLRELIYVVVAVSCDQFGSEALLGEPDNSLRSI